MLKHTINTLLLTSCLAALAGCSAGGYQRIEEKSLPRYQTGTPVMSDLRVVCRAQVFIKPEKREKYYPGIPQLELAKPLDFSITYDKLWDFTVYPTYPKTLRKFDSRVCVNGVWPSTITNDGIGTLYTQLEPEYKYDTRYRYNGDPTKGAVRVWGFGHIQFDGLNYLSTLVGFQPLVIEGDKLPTGSNFSNGKFTGPSTHKEAITINGREWQYYKSDYRESNKTGVRHLDELYTTKVGNYTFMALAVYDDNLATYAPEWVIKRQAFLRHWLESFKFEPINTTIK